MVSMKHGLMADAERRAAVLGVQGGVLQRDEGLCQEGRRGEEEEAQEDGKRTQETGRQFNSINIIWAIFRQLFGQFSGQFHDRDPFWCWQCSS